MSTSASLSTVAPTAGATVHLLGTLVTFRATADRTGGAFSLVEAATAPGLGTPAHRQGDAEAFYVLDGAYEFEIDGNVAVGRPGDFFFVPAGAVHAFRNPGPETARMLIINLPAGPHERFFCEAGDPVADNAVFPTPAAPDIPRLLAAAERAGIEMVGGN
ncbi:cupin domain-containing protein [Acuticoccus kandeliae]|uniref:cupin domain-containing protein n=1 Tax=Acuticoccus kandeliae TaxID=2073160 RepID=UPI000D3EA2E4|nr:cupin domain-containing protein [Acuticoccus kandeliae]